jgi:hypothetical protein
MWLCMHGLARSWLVLLHTSHMHLRLTHAFLTIGNLTGTHYVGHVHFPLTLDHECLWYCGAHLSM